MEFTNDALQNFETEPGGKDDLPSSKIIKPLYGLPIRFKQKTEYGCGSYSLANLFNVETFIFDIKDGGERTIDLNAQMQKSYVTKEWFIETLFLANTKISQDQLIDEKLFDVDFHEIPPEVLERVARPFLFIVNRPGSGFLHYIAVLHNFKDNLFYCLDSRQENVLKFNVYDLLNFYWVVGVEYFGDFTGEPMNEVFVDKKDFTHIIPKGE